MDMETLDRWRLPIVAGLVGSLIAAFKSTPGTSAKEKAFNVFAGTAIAAYVSPGLTEWLGMKSPNYQTGAAFVLGLVGMSLAAALIKGIGETPLGAILASWFSRKG